MHAYASVDFSGTQHYDEEVFYNNHRFKKPVLDEAPSPRSKVVERYSHPAVSPAPFAKDLVFKGEKEPCSSKVTDLAPGGVPSSNAHQRRLEKQERNRNRYHYKKYLKERYEHQMESIQKASDRYKIATIDMALPEVNHLDQKKTHIQDRLTQLNLGDRTSEPIMTFKMRELSNLRGRDNNGKPVSLLDEARQESYYNIIGNITKSGLCPTTVKRNTYESVWNGGIPAS